MAKFVTRVGRGSWAASFLTLAAASALALSGCDGLVGVAHAQDRDAAREAAEAVKRHRKAAERGDAVAQFHLGVSYDEGLGVAQDDAEAVRWYRKAADQGYAQAEASAEPACRFLSPTLSCRNRATAPLRIGRKSPIRNLLGVRLAPVQCHSPSAQLSTATGRKHGECRRRAPHPPFAAILVRNSESVKYLVRQVAPVPILRPGNRKDSCCGYACDP